MSAEVALPDPDKDAVIRQTRAWLEHAVIGLNLCPFANAVFRKNQIEYRVTDARTPEDLLQDLATAVEWLVATPETDTDTLLLIHPRALNDFLDFNDFLDVADALLQESGLDGVLQIASFHPDYQFAGVAADDPTNATNRSPYPVLHLLREASLDQAIASVPDTDQIVERNLATMRELGASGWQALQEQIRSSSEQP